MRIVTRRWQRWALIVSSASGIFAGSIIFHSVIPMIGIPFILALGWKLIDWGIEYQELSSNMPTPKDDQ
jgi:hypothetical protein